MKYPHIYGPSLAVPGHVRSVLEGFYWSVLARPDAVALIDASDGSSVTYQELAEQVNKITWVLYRHLRTLPNYNPDGDMLVGLCLKPTRHLVAAIISVLQVGAAYVALDPSFPVSRVEHIVNDCRPLLLLVQAGASVPPDPFCKVLLMEELEDEVSQLPSQTAPAPPLTSSPSVAVVLYTSGSTGVPKGVRLPHRALLNRLRWQWKTFPYEEYETCCFKTALTFVDSLSEIFGPLLMGRTLLILPKLVVGHVEALVNTLAAHRVRRLVLVPTLLRAILLHCAGLKQQCRLPHLRLWVCSGEVLPLDLLENFFQVFTDGQTICNFYGSTEVLGDVTYVQFSDMQDVRDKVIGANVPIGISVSNNYIFLDNIQPDRIDNSHTNCAYDKQSISSNINGNKNSVANGNSYGISDGDCDGVAECYGELCVYGDNLALGYVGIGYADRFVKVVVEHGGAPQLVYRTGDYASLQWPEAQQHHKQLEPLLYFEGRKDGQLKVRGHRVDCREVERCLLAAPGVTEGIVLCYRPGQLDQALVAFYSSDNNHHPTVSQQQVEQHLAAHLSTYMLPKLHRLSSLPLLVNGKVDRQKLLAEYGNSCQVNLPELVIDNDGSAEEQEVARKLLGVVQNVLGGSASIAGRSLSLSDNFFKLGGNSLNAVLVVTALRDLGYYIGLTQFADAKDFREMAEVLLVSKTAPVDGLICEGADVDSDEFEVVPLESHMQDEVIELISVSFSAKSDMEVATGTPPEVFAPLLRGIFNDMLLQRLSFVVRERASGRIVGCAFNFDEHAEPPVEALPPLNIVMDFIEYMESKVRFQLPQNVGEVIHSFMMGTLVDLPTEVNIRLIKLMEENNIKLARQRKYKAIFTTNTSAATRYICDDLLGYQILSEEPIFAYIAADGTQPFASVPPDHLAVCTVLYV